MIKYLNYRPFVNEAEGKPYVECTGLSTDTKPNEVSLNSLFLELDTKTLYYCSKIGGESEETVYENNAIASGDMIYTADCDFASLGTIDVTFDGTKYTVQKTVDGQFNEWGAPYVEPGYDYSVYPFVISWDTRRDFATVTFAETENNHSLSISSIVTTEAEWTKYGESGSGGGSGDVPEYYVFKDISLSAEDFTQSGSKYTATFQANGEAEILSGTRYNFYLEGDPDSPYTLTCEENGVLSAEIPPIAINHVENKTYTYTTPVARAVVISLEDGGLA